MLDGFAAAFDFVELASQTTSLDRLTDNLSKLAKGIGFNSLIATTLPAYGEEVGDLILADRWPDGWRDRYLEKGYFLKDPVSLRAVSHTEPFTWVDARTESPPHPFVAEIEGDALSYGLADGLLCPVLHSGTMRSIVSFGSDGKVSLSPAEVAAMQIAAVSFLNACARLGVTDINEAQLTEREREVLKWVGAGKTIWEVSKILSISEATVRHHISSARRKLGAANVTQAVAKAIVSRQIWV